MNSKYLLCEHVLHEAQTRQIWGAIIGGSIGGLTWAVIIKVLDSKEASLKRKLEASDDLEEKKRIRKVLYNLKLSKTEERLVAGLSVSFMALIGYWEAYKPYLNRGIVFR